MTTIYFRHKDTGKRFKVLSMDKDAGTITMKGEHATFTEKYSKERFKELGYTLEKETADAE